MAKATSLREVDWCYHTGDPTQWGDVGTIEYRTCDICYESFINDRPFVPRKFFYDDAEGLVVCEHCVEKYLEENAAYEQLRTHLGFNSEGEA